MCLIALLAALSGAVSPVLALTPPASFFPEKDILAAAGHNRREIERALSLTPDNRRDAMQFLIANMPEPDLRSLKGDYLVENVTLACEVFDGAPWANEVPREVFLNDVLPYASLNERRDPWRQKLRQISAPLITSCTKPGEAAQILNRKLFGVVKVRYSTARKRADQSPIESMESGLATCSGLSILLVDACRSVGIPARVVGTPMWTNLRGNHTWVEVWDSGTWHFMGAAEPDPRGLDRGWFVGDAAKARRDIPMHAIYASSFRKTGISFPLIWEPSVTWVQAVNVTERYAPAVAPAPDGKVRLMVRVLRSGKRVAAKVTVSAPSDASLKLEGTSSDESADLNNLLSFNLPRGHAFRVQVEKDGESIKLDVTTTSGTEAEQMVNVLLGK